MSNDYLELFWTLLDLAKYDELRSSIPKNFSWNILHPEYKTTILVRACRFPADGRTEEDILNTVEWLVKSGASISQKCGNSTTSKYSLWKTNDEANTKITVEYRGHSVMSYINAWREALQGKPEWKHTFDFLAKVVDRIAKASGQLQRGNRSAVHESIVDIWEKFLHAKDSHDLDIEAADGHVTAHARMLMGASPVVQAMLASPMQERHTKRIRLKDTSCSAVTLFLETLYTCSSQGDPDYQTALSALDLAHRWQVDVVVEVLADFIEGLIAEASFAAIAEHAALKGLDQLKKACQRFGSENAAIQDQLGKGKFPKVVQDLFQEKATTQPVKKRKCFWRLAPAGSWQRSATEIKCGCFLHIRPSCLCCNAALIRSKQRQWWALVHL